MSSSTAIPGPWFGRVLREEHRCPSAQALAELYHRHYRAVLRYSCAVLRSRVDAEDVAPESFLRLFAALERGDNFANPLAWLIRVAHNLALQRLSHLAPQSSFDDFCAQRAAATDPSPEEQMLCVQRDEEIRAALQLLSPRELRRWTLRSEGLRYREIAEVLDVKTGTVVTLLVRAADKLSKAMEPSAVAAPAKGGRL